MPRGQIAITTKWAFKSKLHLDGTTAKLKARLVARGFQQRASIDFSKTFALVAKTDTFRTLAAICGHQGWSIFLLDVFLNSDLTEEVFV